MCWVGTLFGLMVRTPETAAVIGFVVFLPLTFVANAFVPTEGVPTVLRVAADWNPISATVAACRHLFGNPGAATASSAWPLQHAVLASIGWSLFLIAIFLPLAVRRYRSATAG
jgi:ABC-2 type transport system permease protein